LLYQKHEHIDIAKTQTMTNLTYRRFCGGCKFYRLRYSLMLYFWLIMSFIEG